MKPLKIYCAGGVAPPLIEVAALFELKRGIPVTVIAGNAEELIRAAKAERDADILSVGAEHVMDGEEFDNLISKTSRRTIGYRRSVLLVQKGNPKGTVGLAERTLPRRALPFPSPSQAVSWVCGTTLPHRRASRTPCGAISRFWQMVAAI